MNDSTKGTNMIEPEWHVEGDWSKATRGSEVQLRNRDGQVTFNIHDRLDPQIRNCEPWITSECGATYREPDWTLFVKVTPPVVLPQAAGVYRDENGRHFSISMKDGSGLFGDEVWINDASELEAPFVRLEPAAETAEKVLGRVKEAWRVQGHNLLVLNSVGREFGVPQ